VQRHDTLPAAGGDSDKMMNQIVEELCQQEIGKSLFARAEERLPLIAPW
jgi:hypothetical protein